MTETSPVQIEVEPKPIRDMPALQARILLSDQSFLDPAASAEAPLLEKKTVSSFAERNYGLFEAASVRERKTQQENANIPFEERYKNWSASVLKHFNSDENKERMAKLKPLLQITNEAITDTDIQQLYDKYLDTAAPPSGIKTFVQDIIAKYQKNGIYDLAAFTQDREVIVWVAQLFGSTSSEMIDQLITAEMKLLYNPETCYQELNKTRNTVTAPEQKMMGFVYNKEVATAAHAVEKGDLPIEGYEEQIKKAILDNENDTIIISAGTGAGKTTKIPQYIAKILKPGEKVVVTQPRRLPTESLAANVAKQMGVKLGEEVGYSHGKGKKVSKDTRMLFTVEKSLLIQLSKDPYLEKYNYVMVDEWHERHKDTDLLVSLLRRAQKLRKQKGGMPPLKIIITSATMDKTDLEKQLGTQHTQSFEVPGRAFTIDAQFEPKGSPKLSVDSIPTRAAQAALKMVQTRPANRNILLFMPGDRLITQTYDAIQKLNLPKDVVIDMLIGTMTREEQEKVINVSDGKKHIIISSPIAETSLTIERVDVISSGLVNVPRVDPANGLYFLEEILHSKKGLEQQKGRTGRESNGVWRFLGTEEEYNGLVDHHAAEILRTDISDEVLLLKKMGLTLDQIPLIDKDKLPQQNILRAQRRLKDLDALDDRGEITEIGKQMVDIPLDIHYSRMLVAAQEKGCLKDAVTLAVVCSQTDLYQREEDIEKSSQIAAQREFEAPGGSDFLARLRMYNKFIEVGKGESDFLKREELRKRWAKDHYLRYAALERIEAARVDLLDRLNYRETGAAEITDEAALARCIFEGFKDNLLTRGNPHTDTRTNTPMYSYSLNGEQSVNNGVIDRYSTVDPASTQYAVTAGNYARQTGAKRYIFMQMNQRVDPKWLRSGF